MPSEGLFFILLQELNMANLYLYRRQTIASHGFWPNSCIIYLYIQFFMHKRKHLRNSPRACVEEWSGGGACGFESGFPDKILTCRSPRKKRYPSPKTCLLYTSDAADEEDSVDL